MKHVTLYYTLYYTICKMKRQKVLSMSSHSQLRKVEEKPIFDYHRFLCFVVNEIKKKMLMMKHKKL